MNPTQTIQGQNFTATELGSIDAWKSYTAEVASLPGMKVPGKLFLNQILKMTGMEVSVNCLPAGGRVPFYHTHKAHEELYIFVKGRGQFQIDGDIFEVQEGTTLCITPNGERTWRNNSQEDLYYLVIQAPVGMIASAGTEGGVTVQRKVTWP